MAEFEDGIIEDLLARETKAAADLTDQIEQDLLESISAPTGPGNRSAPGDPPGKEFGTYYDSIQSDVVTGDDLISFSVFTDFIRGLWLEKGTHSKDGSVRMEPRPHFEPCYQRQKPAIIQRVGEAIDG